MADQIVPLPIRDIASWLEEEVNNLRVCRTLMLDALQFICTDVDETMAAQEKLFYLVNSLKDQQKRFDDIAAAAHNFQRTQKLAA